MKSKLVLLTLFPTFAHASGGDILSLIWLELGLLITVMVLIFATKLSLKSKLIVFFAYIVSAILAFGLTSGLPYTKNLVLINTVSILVPVIVTVITWTWRANRTQT
jgi:hypothetical protein